MPIEIIIDGYKKNFVRETCSIKELILSIDKNLLKSILIGEVDGIYRDLDFIIEKNSHIRFITFENKYGQQAYRHTTAHILAQAVIRLYPNAKLAIGPSIENGFYYDFDVEQPFSEKDLQEIEKMMKIIIKENLPIKRFTLSKSKAIQLMHEKEEPYKVELIEKLPDNQEISFYQQGEFLDLCAGPHLLSTGRVKSIKLISSAGAYWRGDEKNKMLQRIYGTSFPNQAALDNYVLMIEEAKKRDHRKLGRELDLFATFDEAPGCPFFLPKGMVIRNILENLWRKEHKKRGYMEIKTPVILNEELWHKSGHWDHYKENMYFTEVDKFSYALKPMNCPGGMLVYKRNLTSYRDLPQRLTELGLIHRHELSGVLHGLMRARCFTQDDAHIFMRPDQIRDEIIGVISLINDFYKIFEFDYHVELSTKPENSIGSDDQWEAATNALRDALEYSKMEYQINEGDGAFYGPKIDFHILDSMNRSWQCGTVQLDFQMPERFDLTYIASDGEKHRPVVIHRVVFGSIERFIAILTEHYAGAFPTWLTPVQVKILPILQKHHQYSHSVKETLEKHGFRVEEDLRDEKIGYKIREAQLEKVPYMIILGDKEEESNELSVRSRNAGVIGTMTVDSFTELIYSQVKNFIK